MNKTYKYMSEKFCFSDEVIKFAQQCEECLKDKFAEIDENAEINQYKVLKAMQKNKLSDVHFSATTGYGYNDLGRDTLENIYADVFNAESALVRPQLISGTHALTVALFGNLRHGDEMLSATGKPYDTLETVIGAKSPVKGSLTEYGIIYKEADLNKDKLPDIEKIVSMITDKTKLVEIQRSKGYDYRPSLTVSQIKEIINAVKQKKPDCICMIDNCYGEFVETIEPTDIGADLVVGSLIKNPGGGLAPVGGYIVGKEKYVDMCAFRLTAPGLGKEVGPTLGVTPSLIQGLFLSPTVVSGSLKGAVFASKMFESLGFEVMPKSTDPRADIVQSIALRTPENVIEFCGGIQAGAPVDSYVTPEPWAMPGYDCDVIMAAGAFVQGSSVELSADAPMREPYIVYMQGGLTWYHAKVGIITALDRMYKKGLAKID